MRVHVGKTVGILPARVVAVKERSIPKTTSGKIQRRQTKASLDVKGGPKAGGLDIVFDSKCGRRAAGRDSGCYAWVF